MEHYFTNNENLKSELRNLTLHIADTSLTFVSDLGVFAKDKIDYGSKLLIDVYLKEGRSEVSLLDVGCGYGVIGITLAKLLHTQSTLVDVNKRALHLAKMNAKEHKVDVSIIMSDGYDSVFGKFDCIMTNPPIRAGKATVMRILENAKEFLNDSGELWFVMRKDQGAKSAIAKLKEQYNIEIKEKSKGFYIIVAKKLLT